MLSAQQKRQPKIDVGALDVSVVMAVHKGVQIDYLKEAVFSILSQTLSNYEFLIIADGALEQDQEAFIRLQQSRDERIVFLKTNENRGPGATRNKGIALSKGRYVAVMDSDDVSLPDRLAAEVSYLDEHPDVAVVGTACEVIDEEGNTTGYRHLPETPASLTRYALFFCPLNNPTVMARTAIIRSFLYDETWRNGEDYRLWLKLLAAGYSLANMPDYLLRFRVDSQLYKRRVGFQKARSDLMHRVFALRIAPFYLVPPVLLFALLLFSVRFLPHYVVRYLTAMRDYFRVRQVRLR